eukprot:gene3287-628_t
MANMGAFSPNLVRQFTGNSFSGQAAQVPTGTQVMCMPRYTCCGGREPAPLARLRAQQPADCAM